MLYQYLWDGSAWAFGSNVKGRLGLDPLVLETNIPTRIPSENFFLSVSCGHSFSLLLDNNGQVWGCGSYTMGPIVPAHDQSILNKIEGTPPIQMISTGKNHALLLDQSGEVWSFGANSEGQLGLGHYSARTSPNKVTGMFTPVIQIASGYDHNLVLDSNKNVWGFGSNNCSQMGSPAGIHKISPFLFELQNIIQIWCGGDSCYVTDDSRRVFVFGRNYESQLGIPDTQQSEIRTPTENPLWAGKIVIPGGSHSFTVDRNGDVTMYGQLFGVQMGSTITADINLGPKISHSTKSARSVA